MMNKYARIAQDYWRSHAPTRYAALEDPEGYFTELGDSAAFQIDQMARELEARLPADLPYLERVAQLRAVKQQAEETVLTDLVYSIPPEPASLAAELDELLGELPSAAAITVWIEKIQQDAADEAEREGFSAPLLTDEQAARVTQLQALLPLVTAPVEDLTEPELRDRVLALRAFWDPETRALIVP